jgi:hypothetical protein
MPKPSILHLVSSTDTPERPLILLSLILNVNNEGTGGTIICPSFLKASHTFVLLPAAISK